MLGLAAALVCFGTLAVAGPTHLRHLQGFSNAVAAQRVWPRVLATPIAALTAVSEVTVGFAGLACVLLLGTRDFVMLSAAAAGTLYLLFVIYGGVLLFRRPGVPCACSVGDEPINVLVVARAGTLAVTALVTVIELPVTANIPSTEGATAALAALTYGMACWCLPGALRNPFVARDNPESFQEAQ